MTTFADLNMMESPDNRNVFKLIVDMKPLAELIEMKFAQRLEAPPTGIYSATKVDPVMVDGERYYVLKDKKEFSNSTIKELRHDGRMIDANTVDSQVLVAFDDINAVTTPVYNKHGKCIISATVIKQKTKLLSDSPILPYRGIKIARNLYDQRIDEVIRWRHTRRDWIGRIAGHLMSPTSEGMMSGIEDRDLFEQEIYEFYLEVGEHTSELMDGHEWCIYATSQHDTTLKIERGEDYRILDWMRKFRAEETKGEDD